MNRITTLHLQFLSAATVLLMSTQPSNCDPSANGQNAVTSSASSADNVELKDYGFGFWQNGLRKHKGSNSKDILCIETGYYGFAVDVAAINSAKYADFTEAIGYKDALLAKDKRMQNLAPANLRVELEKGGKLYRAVRCKAAAERAEGGKMQSARLWESARFVQHYDMLELEFVTDQGEKLVANSRLDIVAWPQSLTINAEIEPVLALADGAQQGVRGKGHGVHSDSYLVAHQPELEHEQFTLETWIKVPKVYIHKNRGWIVSKNKNGAQAGFFGMEIHGDRILGTMNIDGGGWKNRVTISTTRHAIVPDRWQHLALTYDGKRMAIYVDGTRRDSVEINKKRKLGNGEMRIGRLADNSGKSVKLIADQVRMWNRVLSPHELRQNGRDAANLGQRKGLTYVNDFEQGPELQLPVWNNAKMRISLQGGKNHWHTEQTIQGPWTVGQQKTLSLNCRPGRNAAEQRGITAVMKHNGKLPVVYRKEFDCYAVSINRPKRAGKSGYSDIRDYDEIDLTVSAGHKGKVPFLMEMFRVANITGVCPILCDESGVPTGIPVQLSKNWHDASMGDYVRAYMLLPAHEHEKKYKLKFAYGFYGKLPSASHAQLSLVGYAGNGRWDQLAIGCWGETYCMDVDMSCTDVAVTDVRMLMARAGEKGVKWAWTDAGWGGDWLGLETPDKKKLLINGGKAAYMAHGPCMSEVSYSGYYGAGREVAYDATVRTLRTDDHARTFTAISYNFDKAVSADGWLFKMGRTGGYITPKIAYGNVDGLIAEQAVPAGLKRDQVYVERTTLQGKGPWWVAFPGAHHHSVGGHISGTGYRAMVIRSYKAVIDGKEYHNPTVKFPCFYISPEGGAGLDFLLTAPEGVSQFKPGDQVHIDVEWITLPRNAQDYYGPNEVFRNHLKANPSSWKTTHREALGNHLEAAAQGGLVKSNYPVIVRAQQPRVVVSIKGGVGYVPIRFEGLASPKFELFQLVNGKEQKLDQSVHGNDFWQTDYHAATKTYQITYNLPLDGLAESKWILKPAAAAAPAPVVQPTPPSQEK